MNNEIRQQQRYLTYLLEEQLNDNLLIMQFIAHLFSVDSLISSITNRCYPSIWHRGKHIELIKVYWTNLLVIICFKGCSEQTTSKSHSSCSENRLKVKKEIYQFLIIWSLSSKDIKLQIFHYSYETKYTSYRGWWCGGAVAFFPNVKMSTGLFPHWFTVTNFSIIDIDK